MEPFLPVYLLLALPAAHICGGFLFISVIAPRIAANRDMVRWLNVRYDNRSLRKLFLYAVGCLLWEVYWLGLVLYTVYAKVSSVVKLAFVKLSSLRTGKRAVKEQQATRGMELEDTTRRPREPELGERPDGSVGDRPISDGLPPSYQSLRVWGRRQ
ncbi:uncharacterized protein PG998_009153 [Apiospora kogelbergensis]|uniref:Uncharacterized protein n=1 Tax=Apiospora kogelbergensis TaxID=1337665 RepID=A0AAW0R6V3_9PEZI